MSKSSNVRLYVLYFPDSVKNPELYSIHVWVKNENKGGPAKFVPVKDSRICSEHFRLACLKKMAMVEKQY